MGLNVFDGYNVRARICVCAIYSFPFVIDVALLSGFSIGVIPAICATVILISTCQIALILVRHHGCQCEVGNIAAELLLPKNDALGCTKSRYYRKLSTQEPEFAIFKLVLEGPSAFDDEQLKPVCEDVVRWIRAKTRHRGEFPLVREENINYGFARNMLALRQGGLWINLSALIILCLTVCYSADSVGGMIHSITMAQAVCLLIHASFFLFLKFFVTHKQVVAAAKKYSFALLETIALF